MVGSGSGVTNKEICVIFFIFGFPHVFFNFISCFSIDLSWSSTNSKPALLAIFLELFQINSVH